MLAPEDRYYSRCAEIRVVGADGLPVEAPYLEPLPPIRRTNFADNRAHMVAAGETLASLAAKYLGDARHWKAIAEFTGMIDPFAEFEPGDILVIPSAETFLFVSLREEADL